MTVVPRWEWRTTGASLDDAERRLAQLEPARVEESADRYILSATSDASVKVRGGVLDVKLLQRVDGALEQWKPIAKLPFPLTPDGVRIVLDALGVEARAPVTGDGLDGLLAELVEPRDDLAVVVVRKRRSHYTFAGCMAELSDIVTEHGATRTIAVEFEDPDRVLAAVRELGLDGRPNVSLPRELKAMIGLGARRYAVVDVGTNSVKFHVAELRADGEWRRLVDRADVTRLGEGLDTSGQLAEEPMRRTVEAIASMADEATRHEVAAIAAVGTAGLRIAPNREELVDAVRARTGIAIEVIPGEEEARLAYLAATGELHVGSGSLAVFDTGGGSSQFTFGRAGRSDEQFSVNVGAARFTEQYGLDKAVTAETLAAALDHIARDLSRLDGREPPAHVVGMGGAVTNLAAVKHRMEHYDPDLIHGTILDVGEIDRQIAVYRERDADARRDIVGLQPARAAVILAGACIVRTILAKLGCASFVVSDRALRHGLLRERFGPPAG